MLYLPETEDRVTSYIMERISQSEEKVCIKHRKEDSEREDRNTFISFKKCLNLKISKKFLKPI